MRRNDPPHFRKPAFFIRCGSLICIWPNGKIAKVFGYEIAFWDYPCYSAGKIIKKFNKENNFNDQYGKFKTPQEALKAMRKYERNNLAPKAKFIGY